MIIQYLKITITLIFLTTTFKIPLVSSQSKQMAKDENVSINLEGNFVSEFNRNGLFARFNSISINFHSKHEFSSKRPYTFVHTFKELANKSFASVNYNLLQNSANNSTELMWFPVKIGVESACNLLEKIASVSAKHKYVLLHFENSEEIKDARNCPIGFESQILIYYTNKTINQSTVVLEEIYKLDKASKHVQRNILASYSWNTSLTLLGLTKPSWIRKSNLEGLVFNSIFMVNDYPAVYETKEVTDKNGKTFHQPSGTYIQILDILMKKHNFYFSVEQYHY